MSILVKSSMLFEKKARIYAFQTDGDHVANEVTEGCTGCM